MSGFKRYSLDANGRTFPDPHGAWMYGNDVDAAVEAAAEANLRLAEEHARVVRERDEAVQALGTVRDATLRDVFFRLKSALGAGVQQQVLNRVVDEMRATEGKR